MPATAHILRSVEVRGRPVGIGPLPPLRESLGSNSGCQVQQQVPNLWKHLTWPQIIMEETWGQGSLCGVSSLHPSLFCVGSGTTLRWPGFPTKSSHPPFYEFESHVH